MANPLAFLEGSVRQKALGMGMAMATVLFPFLYLVEGLKGCESRSSLGHRGPESRPGTASRGRHDSAP